MSTPKTEFTLPLFFDETFQKNVLDLEVHDSDTWVISFPRSGTTWTQEMVWMIANDLDYEGGEKDLNTRFPELELTSVCDISKLPNDMNLTEDFTDSVSYVKKLKHPRFIKTHLPWCYLPRQIQNGTKKPKIVYVARNPKDVCLSYYKHNTLVKINTEPFDKFCEMFLEGKLMYTPYWKQVGSYWEHRQQPNILFSRYEDMITDLPGVIRRVAKFFNKKFTDEQVKTLSNHLRFDSMKKNDAVNREAKYEQFRKVDFLEEGSFIRSGKIGGHKDAMTPEMIKKFDKWIHDNIGELNDFYKIQL